MIATVLGLMVTGATLALLAAVADARAQEAAPLELAVTGFEQRLGSELPLDLVLSDAEGKATRLGDLFGHKPVILSLNYFHCPDLCPLMLEGLMRSLRDVPASVGEEFSVVVVSIDPNETAALAAQKKQELVSLYGRPGAAAGWHFLVGAPLVVQLLAQAVGLHYVFDSARNEYAHPLGVVVVTPQGQIARYLFGLEIPARDLRFALVETSDNHIGSLTDRVALLCYHYDPLSGKYSSIALDAARWVGLASMAGLGLFLISLWRRELAPRRGSELRVDRRA
jgi:protein SCO1/2